MGGATLYAAYPILRRLINGSAKLITHSIKRDQKGSVILSFLGHVHAFFLDIKVSFDMI